MSDMTVSRQLTYDFGLKLRKPGKKSLLTKSVTTKSLAFAKAHQHWTTKHWSKVLFSDDSTIHQFVAREQNVLTPKGKRCNAKYTI